MILFESIYATQQVYGSTARTHPLAPLWPAGPLALWIA